MSDQFKIVKPGDLFLAHNTGTQIARDAFCEHGQRAVMLVMFGHYHSQQDQHQRLDAVLPRCVVAELLGAVQAQIRHDEGEGALQAFLDEIAAHAEESAQALEQLHRQRRDCCEAGFRTNGREHTCGRDEEGPSR